MTFLSSPLAYVGFGLALLVIGLLQTHAGCMFPIGDCYQHGLPSYWLEAKVGVNSGLRILNGLALTFVYLNIRSNLGHVRRQAVIAYCLRLWTHEEAP